MSCKYYNNNGYSCAGCVRFVKSLSITFEDDNILITIPEMVFKNHQKICLCLAQAIPEEIGPNTTVIVEIGTAKLAKMPVITRRGNLLYADSIRSRKVYPLMAATDTSALVLEDMCKLGDTEHVFPTVPAIFPPEEK